jgi:hypothetical protein
MRLEWVRQLLVCQRDWVDILRCKRILRCVLTFAECRTILLVECSCECICIGESEASSIDRQLRADEEILRLKDRTEFILRHAMTLHKHTLREAAVRHSRFGNVKRIIFEIEVERIGRTRNVSLADAWTASLKYPENRSTCRSYSTQLGSRGSIT